MPEYPEITSEHLTSLKKALDNASLAYWRAMRATPSIPPAQINTTDRMLAERLITMTAADANNALIERCSWGELPTERLNRLVSNLRHTTAQNYA